MDLRQRPLEIFFPLALKLKLGRFEVRHALSYFFAFEEPVLGAGGFLRCAITGYYSHLLIGCATLILSSETYSYFGS
jgi:hypothetical protein